MQVLHGPALGEGPGVFDGVGEGNIALDNQVLRTHPKAVGPKALLEASLAVLRLMLSPEADAAAARRKPDGSREPGRARMTP